MKKAIELGALTVGGYAAAMCLGGTWGSPRAWLDWIRSASLLTDFVMGRTHLLEIEARVESHAGVRKIGLDGRYSET